MSREKKYRQQLKARLILTLFAASGLFLASHWNRPLTLMSTTPTEAPAVSERFVDPEIPEKFDQMMERWN